LKVPEANAMTMQVDQKKPTEISGPSNMKVNVQKQQPKQQDRANVEMRATYVQAPKNQPSGINMNDFVMNDANNPADDKKNETKRDIEIIN
jgi:hypothetical protein